MKTKELISRLKRMEKMYPTVLLKDGFELVEFQIEFFGDQMAFEKDEVRRDRLR